MIFKDQIRQGIPAILPPSSSPRSDVSHAPRRKDILSNEEKRLAIRNALRYFSKKWHRTLAPEFAAELSAGSGNHADDTKQSGPCRSTASRRAHHVWRQRIGFSKLGSVPIDDAVSVSYD